MTLTANWSYPTQIRFGAGRIAEIDRACRAAGMARPLLITDRGLAGLPITVQTLDRMEAAGLGRAIFADVDPNPNEKNVAAGLTAYREGGHDGVIAFGGGSGLDLAKTVAFMAGQTRPLWDFEDIGDWWTRADADAIAPIVAVPTTAGTGSEVGFQKGLGAIHALSHPIGAMHHTHHGTTNAVVMPAVLRFNRQAIEVPLGRAATYLGIAGGYEGFCDWVDEMNTSMAVPATLTALGVENPDIDRLVAGALKDPSTGGNPVEMTEANTRSLLMDCL